MKPKGDFSSREWHPIISSRFQEAASEYGGFNRGDLTAAFTQTADAYTARSPAAQKPAITPQIT